MTAETLTAVQAAFSSQPEGETLDAFGARLSAIVGEPVDFDPGSNALCRGAEWVELVVRDGQGDDHHFDAAGCLIIHGWR